MIHSERQVPLLEGYNEKNLSPTSSLEQSKEGISFESVDSLGKGEDKAQDQTMSTIGGGPKLETNRIIAVLAANTHHLTGFCYAAILKHISSERGVSVLDIRLMTNIIVLISSFCLAKSKGVSLYVEPKDRCRLLMRCILDTAWQVTFVYGLVMIPLVISSTIMNTQPFWATIIGYSILREQITRLEIIAMTVSFTCVIIVAFSGQAPPPGDESSQTESEQSELMTKLVGCSLMLITAALLATFTVLTRQSQAIHYAVNLFYFNCFNVPAMLLLILIQSLFQQTGGSVGQWSEYDGRLYTWMLLIGAVNFLARITQVLAFQNERPGFISLVGYVSLVYAFLGDWLIFDESFTAIEILCIAVILVANFTVIFTKQNQQAPSTQLAASKTV